MQKFNIGDRVVVVVDSWDMGLENKVATVVGFGESSRVGFGKSSSGIKTIDIQVDDWARGHCGSTGAPSTKCDRWNVAADEIKLVEAEDFLDVDPIIDVQVMLPTDSKDRKNIPLASGVFDYFTSALIEVAKVSFAGNEQHNPGEPLHWAQDKSTDHADTLLRHFAERGSWDTDGQRHSAKVAWRALAMLQMELQKDGYPKARGAR